MSDYLKITTGSGGDDGDGDGGKRKRTEGMKDSSDEEVDADTLRDRLRAAQLRLAPALYKMYKTNEKNWKISVNKSVSVGATRRIRCFG
jgi:hypothetical protein